MQVKDNPVWVCLTKMIEDCVTNCESICVSIDGEYGHISDLVVPETSYYSSEGYVIEHANGRIVLDTDNTDDIEYDEIEDFYVLFVSDNETVCIS